MGALSRFPRRPGECWHLAALGALAAALAALLTLPAPASAEVAEAAECAKARAPGGEWRSYGRNLWNTRHQQREKVISPANAHQLEPSWSLATEEAGGAGSIAGTPVVVDGCAYAATNQGWVFAVNADTGEPVWKRRIPHGGPVYGTVTVRGGLVYVAAAGGRPANWCIRGSCAGPYVVALRQRNGRVAWVSRALDVQPGADVYGSPVISRRVLMIGISGGAAELGDESDRDPFQGAMSFLDARTGRVLEKSWSIHPPHRPDDEFAGATIWSTPGVDRRARVAYAGTSNPFQPEAEHEHANAVLKYNVDRRSRRFGKIVGSYKGDIEEYLEAYSELPCVAIPGNPPPWYPQGVGQCGDIDLDFGAAPNIFIRDRRKLVGAGQKSGVYHVFDARTMEPVWSQIVGPPSQIGGIVGSTAYDGRSIHGPITVPGYVWSISAEGGSVRWLAPLADVVHWGPPVASANGVVYTVDFTGFLDAFDAETGRPLLKQPLLLGTEHARPVLTWGGVSVARNTVYASVGLGPVGSGGGYLVAFRVDGERP